MRVCTRWLSEYVLLNVSIKYLVDRLSLFGFEVNFYNDDFIDLNILPNRGDCLGIYFISRELFSIFYFDNKFVENINICILYKFDFSKYFNVNKLFIYYECKVIENLCTHLITPKYIKNRLINSGFDLSCFFIDIINYVFLEYGQPFDVYDYDLVLNDLLFEKNNSRYFFNKNFFNNNNVLITKDLFNLLSITGIKSIEKYNITSNTKKFILGVGCYNSKDIRISSKQLELNTFNSYRFERNVSIGLQNYSIKKVSFILFINNFNIGSSNIYEKNNNLYNNKIFLENFFIKRILGINFSDFDLQLIFKKLYVSYLKMCNGWYLLIPKFRKDILKDIDVVEEIIRLYGMHSIIDNFYDYKQNFTYSFCDKFYSIKLSLVNKGYNEVINYSFVSDKIEKLLNPFSINLILKNPISNDMNVMRSTLLCGLLFNLKYNFSRQKYNIKFFELGKVFLFNKNVSLFDEQNLISGVCSGNIFNDQWNIKSKKIDFFDVKNDIEFLFYSINKNYNLTYFNSSIFFLDKDEGVNIYINNIFVGFFGLFKNKILSNLFITFPVYLFEINLDILFLNNYKTFVKKLSKYPVVSRDLTFLLKDIILSKDVLDTIYYMKIPILKDILIIDLYKGPEIPNAYKSISFRFLMQSLDCTLLDEVINLEIEKIVSVIFNKYEAILR